jgi:hypothetical protein
MKAGMKSGDDDSVAACRIAEHHNLLIVEDDEKNRVEPAGWRPPGRQGYARQIGGAAATAASSNPNV